MSLIYKFSEDVAPSLRDVLKERGWKEWDQTKHDINEWNLSWTTKRYVAKELYGLQPHQKVNHFRNTNSITKKDNLLRNLRRMRSIYGKIYDFFPQSWMIPLQFSEFLRLQKDSNDIWIAKPASGRRGQDISIFKDVSQFSYSQSMIIQKYIDNPLLIGGYKFDLRLYILVTSFRPLKIWLYDDGLCRFSTEKYDLKDLDNIFSHLTNASINKDSVTYDTDKPIIGQGSKWTLKQLFKFLVESKICHANTMDKINHKIRDIVILTLVSIVSEVEQSVHCFELFGFDIMIDDKFKCWLLEVNGSPAIAMTCKIDQMVKNPMLNDLIQCIRVESINANLKNTESKHYENENEKENVNLNNKNKQNDNNNNESNKNEKNDEMKINEESEPKIENKVCVGGYQLIYPFNNITKSNNLYHNQQTQKYHKSGLNQKALDSFQSQRLTFTQLVVNQIKQQRTSQMKKCINKCANMPTKQNQKVVNNQ